MSEIALLWLVQNVTPAIVFEGIKYVVDKHVIAEHRRLPGKYRKALEHSVRQVSDGLKNEHRPEGQQLSSPMIMTRLGEVLCSPDIDKEKFLKLLLDEGIGQDTAEELLKEVEKNFVRLLEDEGIKNNHAFNNIVLLRTREMLTRQKNLEVTDKQIIEALNSVFESNERYLKQIQETTRETYGLVAEANKQLKNMPAKLIQQLGAVDKNVSDTRPRKIRSSQFGYTIKITKPVGFPEMSANSSNCFSGLQNWLKSPYRKGSQLDEYGKSYQSVANEHCGGQLRASEYYIEGEVIPWNSNLHIEISIRTDRWYWQGKYSIDSSGKFQGVVYMHPNYSSARIRFDIMNENVVLLTFDVEMR